MAILSRLKNGGNGIRYRLSVSVFYPDGNIAHLEKIRVSYLSHKIFDTLDNRLACVNIYIPQINKGSGVVR